jgi:RimJ/RimL family protein N-acetyltransferase
MAELELRRFGREDYRLLIEWVPTLEALKQWAGLNFRFPLDEPQLDAYLDGENADPPIRRVYKAVELVNGETAGHIALNHLDFANRSATVSRVMVAPGLRRKGLGTRMVEKILEVGFEELKLHRIELAVFDFNRSAIACYEKVGFKTEGYFRDVLKVGDAYWSQYRMAILEKEWRIHRREPLTG